MARRIRRNRCGDDQRAAQSQAAGAYDRLRQGEGSAHDLEIDDAAVAAKAMANSRMTATVSFSARIRRAEGNPGCEGWRQAAGVEAVTLDRDGVESSETIFFNAGDAGVKSIGFQLEPLPGEENAANNAVSRLVM